MKKNEPITKIMTSDPKSVHTKQSVSEVRRMLSDERFNHVPVVSGKKLVGIISASDILGVSIEGIDADDRSLDSYLDHQFTIEKLMTKKPETLKLSSKVRDAARTLSEGTFHSLPVVDDDGNLEGIVTSTDLIRYLVDQY